MRMAPDGTSEPQEWSCGRAAMRLRVKRAFKRLAFVCVILTSVVWFGGSWKYGLRRGLRLVNALGPVCHGEGQSEPAYDLLKMTPPSYLSNYRNPCWVKEDTVHCLPLFYIIGQPKCGTTDLFSKLAKHPEVASEQPYSAIHWVARGRFKKQFRAVSKENITDVTFSYVSNMFGSNALELRNRTTPGDYHPMIIGDASPSTFADNPHWTEYVGNEGCTEPRIVNPLYLRHILPQARVILTLRDPTDRLYSSYYYFLKEKGSPEDFHERVVEEVQRYRQCFIHHPVRHCAYDNSLITDVAVVKGLYAVFLEDWLMTFPRDQMFVSLLEDFNTNPTDTLSKIFKFLGVSQLSDGRLRSIAHARVKNKGRKRSKAPPMLPETRQFLDDFYKPFNLRLKELLQKYPNPV